MSIPGVALLESRIFADDRGSFTEVWNTRELASLGIQGQFVQENQSTSRKHVLRGLHFQHPHPQGKLLWVSEGEIYDVLVDLRPQSPTFGHWEAYTLLASRPQRLWVPPGLAHGFYVVSDVARCHYACTDFYAPSAEQTLAWNDPTLAIPWPIPPGMSPLVSPKDSQGQPLALCMSRCSG